MHLPGVKFLRTQKAITMLLPDNIHPENCIYYNGAIVLNVLQNNNRLDVLDLFHEVKKTRDMSFPVFNLCLDWLYLASIAELSNGRIKLCS